MARNIENISEIVGCEKATHEHSDQNLANSDLSKHETSCPSTQLAVTILQRQPNPSETGSWE
jgi:hypothetical protein